MVSLIDYILLIGSAGKIFIDLAFLKITKDIYDLTATNKFAKDFGLKDQIRRAVVSISSNIVEGFEKNNNNEFVRYLKIAKGSVGELRDQLYIALTIGYIINDGFELLNKQLEKLGNQIGDFISYLSKRKNKKTIKKILINS